MRTAAVTIMARAVHALDPAMSNARFTLLMTTAAVTYTYANEIAFHVFGLK